MSLVLEILVFRVFNNIYFDQKADIGQSMFDSMIHHRYPLYGFPSGLFMQGSYLKFQ